MRGTAQQVVEKYQTLAREAATAGDPVAAENYYQHAEHYYRILHANGGGDNRQGGRQPDGDRPQDAERAKADGEPAEMPNQAAGNGSDGRDATDQVADADASGGETVGTNAAEAGAPGEEATEHRRNGQGGRRRSHAPRSEDDGETAATPSTASSSAEETGEPVS